MQQILLIFVEKNTYTTLLGPTRLSISEIFLSKPDFHLYKSEKIQPTWPYSDLHVYQFRRNLPPTRLNGPRRLFGRLE